MLYCDGHFLTAGDLARIDGEIAEVAEANNVSLADVIAEAEAEFGSWLLAKMQSPVNECWSPGLIVSGVLPGSPSTSLRSRISLQQLVVTNATDPTEWSSLQRMVVYLALRNAYENLSRRADKDRFEVKRADYAQSLKSRYEPRFRQTGAPAVTSPLPCPGALRVPGAGSFTATAVSGSGSYTDYDVALTWTGASYRSPRDKGNSESAPSVRQTVRVYGSGSITVDVSGLVPPAGGISQADLAQAAVPTMAATGWNVYVGPKDGLLRLANPTPLPVTTLTYAATYQPTGVLADTGQVPQLYLPIPDVWLRG